MLKPAALFTDGAVLCRRKEIRVFGTGEDGTMVTACLRDAGGRILAENSAPVMKGRFLVLLPPQEARTGCTLTLTDGTDSFTAGDIAIGDVFLAGGQSNMELPLEGADGGRELIPVHEDGLLRFFDMPRYAYVCEEQRAAMDAARWEAIAPGKGGGHSAVAYFFGMALRKAHPEVPVGIIGCNWGGTSITCWMTEEMLLRLQEGRDYLRQYEELCGGKSWETWRKEEDAFQETLARWNAQVEDYRREHPDATWREITDGVGICPWNPPAGPGSPYRPGGLADAMLAEAAPAALTGFLWYQGEDDAPKTTHYDGLMIQLVRAWRGMFGDSRLPFLFVQLPMWRDWDAEETYLWPALRLSQAAARDAIAGSAMACLLDEGEYGNIHPTAKRVVGERLAELAKKLIYGEPGEEAPRALDKYTRGNTMTVCLSAPVRTKDGEAPRLMEIAGADGAFYPANAAAEGSALRLWAGAVPRPVQARYAWCDYSDRVNLIGENGLPLEPFRL